MKTIFRNYGSDSTFEYKIPESYTERLMGLHQYDYIQSNCGLLFKAPCLLHTFGLKKNIWILALDDNLEPIDLPRSCPPNSVVSTSLETKWIAELIHNPNWALKNKKSSENKTYIWTVSERYLNFCKFFVRTFIVLLASLFIATLAFAGQGPLKLAVGESKEVALEDSPRSLDISHPDVIDVQRIGTTQKILVSALRSGTSRLTAHFMGGGTKQWNFQVGFVSSGTEAVPTLSSGSLLRLAREVQRRSGFETVVDNGRIVIFGQMQNEAQLKALVDLCLGREECLPRYTTSTDALRLQTKFFQSLFQELGFTGIVVESSIAGVIARGTVTAPEQLDKVRGLLRSTLNRFEESITVDKSGEDLIETQLTFFRMNLSQLTALGLSTEPRDTALSGAALLKAQIPDLLAQLKAGPHIRLNLPDVVLNALSQNGVIQQISRPTLVIASGGKGEVQAGGELIFQTKGQNQKFYVQNYGLIVTLQPKLSGSGRVSHKVDIKLSSPQSNPNPNAISGVEQSVLSTELSAKPDEQILLTRINQQTNGKSIAKVPLLGSIPILGEIFKSREIRADDTELWIALKSRLGSTTPPNLPAHESKLESQTTQPQLLD